MNLSQLFSYLFFLILLLTFTQCHTKQQQSAFKLLPGDLLFQNTGDGDIDTAIKSVTKTDTNKNYTHIGIVVNHDKQLAILEAIPKRGVCITALEEFINRGQDKTLVSRLKKPYRQYIKQALIYGIRQVGLPYDHLFLWDDDALYCSELIYKMFAHQMKDDDKKPFDVHPMSFNGADGNVLANWKLYYEKLNHPIPEGKTGTNPNLMASSPYLDFVHEYSQQ